jgi:pyruvate dehydrogenase E2 component (dihydrolipoamide acetyltransferase)
MAELVMPRLSDTMEEGTILRWLKADGEQVSRGEELVEIETDKATMIYESDQAGVLQLVAAEGDTLAVGAIIANVGDAAAASADGADAGDAAAASADEADAGVASAGGAQVAGVASAGGARVAGASAEAGDDSDVGDASAHPAAASRQAGTDSEPAGARIKASPLARRIAGESGIDLQALTGSGPGGRIVKADVLASSASTVASEPQPQPQPQGVATAKGQTSDVQLSRTQQTIARRMAESKATIPDFTLQIDVDMEECVKLRAQLKQISQHEREPEAPGSREQLKAPTYNDMVVKACALALREHPTANGSYRDGALQLHSRVNVGVAVAAENTLVVPTVFDADEKSLGEIARETHTLAQRVRDATITPPELGGGTFTVSNLGMYGVRSFSAIINPPQAGILSVGSLAPRAVVSDGAVLARNTMTLTLACDHRILYGAEAAQFLARVRELLETPSALTL